MSLLPHHVVIIMDGNGRWAQRRHLPRHAGHKAGVESTRRVVESCARKELPALTLFAFSSENWRRPATEVSLLMQLFVSTLEREIKRLDHNGVRVRFIGERAVFSEQLQQQIATAERITADNRGLQLNIAVNYGGRWDVLQAVKSLVRRVAVGELGEEQIDEEVFAHALTLADLPEPDLFIRTGGEQRISNFLLWQLAYTELYFTECLWPDFDDGEFDAALEFFAGRQRRFGRTGEQINHPGGHA